MSAFRDSEKERGALIRYGFCPNPATVTGDDTVYNSEANAGTLELFLRMQALKHPEKFIIILHVKPGAIVPDIVCVTAFIGLTPHLDNCPGFVTGIFDRVGEEIFPYMAHGDTIGVPNWHR